MSLQMKYFVLKPKGSDAYAKASRRAISTYAREIAIINPELANDLIDWIQAESYLSAITSGNGESTDDEVNGTQTMAGSYPRSEKG